jgi:hypothetical protein
MWLASIIAAVMLAIGGSDAASAEDAKHVTVIVDYNDGVQRHFTAISWKDGLTALDAMQAAAKHPRGIKFEFKGKGQTALLTKIDDLENEGKGKNWLYRVNGKLADRSFGVFKLKAGDTVLWKFDKYR